MRRLIAIWAALALVLALPAGASAAPPSNDLPAGAIALPGTVPQSFGADTTEASVSEPEDVGCGAGGIDQATVWYTFTPDEGGAVLFDARDTDYLVGINLFAGSPAPDTLFNCWEGAGIESLEAGTTYYLMFADIDGDATNGGTLSVVLDAPPPPVEVSITVDPTAKVNHQTGAANLTGTIACSAEASAFFDISLSQRVGRYTVRAFGFGEAACGQEPVDWAAEVFPDNGTLAGGKASGTIFAGVCDEFQCSEVSQPFNVRLRR